MLLCSDFLARILRYYGGSFDITSPYMLNGRQYDAFAAMHAHEDQYAHLLGTTLWEADSHEFTLFESHPDRAVSASDIRRLAEVIKDEMEPQFVRNGASLPPPEHQYTWLTAVLLSQNAPDAEAIRAVTQVKQTKFYRFYLRGYSEARVLLADLENRKLYTNAAGKPLKKLYQMAFDNIAKAEKSQG